MALSRAERERMIQKEKFIALFVTGSQRTRGNVEESNRVLGTNFDFCDEDIRRLGEEEGIVVPNCAKQKIEEPKQEIKPAEVFEVANSEELHTELSEKELKWREKLNDLPEDDDRSKWCAKYFELESVFDGIMAGTVKASASQARLLLDIKDRCFGRIKEASDETVQSGVLLLPMIGTGASAMICPKCGYQHGDSNEQS